MSSTVYLPSVVFFLVFSPEPELIPTEVEDVVEDLAKLLKMDRPSSTSSSATSSSLSRNNNNNNNNFNNNSPPHELPNNRLSLTFLKDLQLQQQQGAKINAGI